MCSGARGARSAAAVEEEAPGRGDPTWLERLFAGMDVERCGDAGVQHLLLFLPGGWLPGPGHRRSRARGT